MQIFAIHCCLIYELVADFDFVLWGQILYYIYEYMAVNTECHLVWLVNALQVRSLWKMPLSAVTLLWTASQTHRITHKWEHFNVRVIPYVHHAVCVCVLCWWTRLFRVLWFISWKCFICCDVVPSCLQEMSLSLYMVTVMCSSSWLAIL